MQRRARGEVCVRIESGRPNRGHTEVQKGNCEHPQETFMLHNNLRNYPRPTLYRSPCNHRAQRRRQVFPRAHLRRLDLMSLAMRSDCILIIWRNCRVTILLMRGQVTLVHHRSNFVNTSVKHCLGCGPDVKRKVSPAAGSRARTDYLFSPTRRTNSWKRGSLRSGSYVGSTLRAVRLLERSAAAFSNHPKALSLSPIPT